MDEQDKADQAIGGYELRQVHKLTDKSQSIYHETVQTYKSKLLKQKYKINELFKHVKSGIQDKSLQLSVTQDLKSAFRIYGELSEQFKEYLIRIKTTESEQELSGQNCVFNSLRTQLEQVFDEVTNFLWENKSVGKSSHGTSKKSSINSVSSSILAKQRMKAETAKVRFKYVKQETDLQKRSVEQEMLHKKEQVELETARKILQSKREVDEAEAELQVISDQLCALDQGGSYIDSKERTERYVQDQNDNFLIKEQIPQDMTFTQSNRKLNFHDLSTNSCVGIENPNLGEQVPSTTQEETHHARKLNTIEDVSRYLLKKDILVSRLSKFDDKPENYVVWKNTFRDVMNEIDSNPAEEFDLAIKWLGPESKKHAVSLRTSNSRNPAAGLKLMWARLNERYGSPEMIESSIKNKLANFPKVTTRDRVKIYELADTCDEILSLKSDTNYSNLLSYYDASAGVNPILLKLPSFVQVKWRSKAINYKKVHQVTYPPFSFFVDFLYELATTMNDPAFIFEENLTCLPRKEYHKPSFKVAVHKTAVFEPKPDRQIPRSQFRCPLHNAHHSLNTCVAFKDKSIEDRRKIVKDNDICFRCIDSKEHRGYKCPVTIQCNDCGSDRHSTGMHYDYNKYNVPTDSNHFDKPPVKHGGEHTEAVSTKCTQVCKDNAVGRSCAKIVLAKVFSGKDPNHHKLVYAILDDQSNKTLATPELLDEFNECDSKIINYKLSSCVGNVLTTGRQVDGLIIQSFDDLYTFDLPSVIECSDIPNSKDEIPSPDIVKHYAHLSELECFIPPIQDGCDISLLIGRDLPAVHHVSDQRIGSENAPFAQRLPMGWVIIGEVCVGEVHASTDIKVNKINILSNGRPTLLDPCKQSVTCTVEDSSIFDKTPDDDKVGLSHEDRTFLKLMDKQFEMNSQGQWSAPLPFKTLRSRLPNNKVQAEKRAKILDKNLHRDIVKRDHMMTFMTGILNKGHAEVAPPIQENEECWFLPLFGVYHPKKPDKIRGVFDSSASFHNISLNEVMVSGPDLTNNLIGVLLRFRQERIAVSADIEHMFYCFYVIPEHRRYLRFLWYKDNIFGNELIEYQMCVHVFGNRPSPSVANYGLRKAVENADPEVKNFVSKNFYVDDGLASFSSEAEAFAVLNKSKETLWCNGNIRLHKFASNSKEFLTKFDSKDLAKDLIDMNLSDDLPMQNSLGLVWDLNCDKFVYKVSLQDKPSTRRGILSIINGLYDPLGFIAPVAVKGKVILRNLLRNNPDWDEQLSPDVLVEWNNWRNSLYALNDVSIPRCYVADGLSSLQEKQVLVYCDASESAIAAVAYIKGIDKSKKEHYGFIMGKSKVAPLHCNTVPRLELCAALLATHIAKIISEELAIPLSEFTYFSDSRVVLGYINNEKRRFYVYVSNRVERIRQVSLPQQWNYIPTNLNPADQGTRFVNPTDLQESLWLHGPTAHAQESRKISEYSDSSENEIFPLIQPDGDKEVRTEVTNNKTQVQEQDCLGSYRFSKFSSLKRLICAIMVLRTFVKHFKNSRSKISSTINHKLDEYKNAEIFIFKTVQDEHFASEIKCRQNKKYVNKHSSIQDLNPYLDDKGLLRVGGRLNNSDMNTSQKNPIILPGKSHVAKLLVLQCHENTKHQGRHFTEGAVRDAGFWIIGGKKIIRSLLYKCVICKKLRGKLEVQRMADLPADRLIPGPPFSSVGVDTFGPWAVIARKTRGGVANAKRWVLIFTCLTTRAIHLEVIEEMSTSSFINALRRLISIRGNVNIFRSDRGSNFIGATDPLKIDVVNVEDQKVSNFLFNRGCKWLFNPPHASHMGGVWERMIGIVRKVLNGIMLEHGNREITHEVLVTFFAEVSAIVNSRPLVPVSCDSEQPFILSPNMLLTQKSGSSTSFDIGEFNTKDMFKAQWKRVQFLSDLFWTRWKGEFLCCLQQRQKWLETKPNIMENDIVLLREKDVHRNTWPMGIVVNALKSNDDIVRKVQVRVCKDGKTAVYTRPISELVVLVSEQ